MSFEVEQKFRTVGHAEIADRLKALGASIGDPIVQEDAYWNHPSRDFALTNEALRIRRVGLENAITYKGPKQAGPTKTREEIEIPFLDGPDGFQQMTRFFQALGFRPVAVVRKERTPCALSYEGRSVEVALDLAEAIGTFVEVEAIAETASDLAEAQRVVLSLASTLGLTEIEPRSYLRMALEHRGTRAADSISSMTDDR